MGRDLRLGDVSLDPSACGQHQVQRVEKLVLDEQHRAVLRQQCAQDGGGVMDE
jgi:hypothetical protein